MSEPFLHSIADEPGCFLFWCPGCCCAHQVDQRWTVEGTAERPTIHGSVLVRGPPGGDGTKLPIQCHLFVEDGNLRFLSDCGHALAGKTVPMEPFP